MKKNLDLYSNEGKRLEKASGRCLNLNSDFHTLLSERLMIIDACIPNENGDYVNEIILAAVTQVDPVLAYRFFKG